MELNQWVVEVMDSQDQANIGDVFTSFGKNFITQIISIRNEVYQYQVNGEILTWFDKNSFHELYDFDQKLTNEYLIKNIIK